MNMTMSNGLFRPTKFNPFFFALVLACTAPLPAVGQEIPSVLRLAGQITAGADGPRVTQGALVLVINESTREKEGQGSVLDDSGIYLVSMTKSPDFDRTRLTMYIQVDASKYQLLLGSSPVSFPYFGGRIFPTTLTYNLTVGAFVGSVGDSPTGGGAPPRPRARKGDIIPENKNFDVNEDGVFNQADIDLVKRSIGSSNPHPRADINGDRIVSTRDAITLIKFFTSTRRRGAGAINVEWATDAPSDDSSGDDGNANE